MLSEEPHRLHSCQEKFSATFGHFSLCKNSRDPVQVIQTGRRLARSQCQPKETLTKYESIDVGDVEGHTIGIGVMEGTNVNRGSHPFLDGARTVSMGFSDQANGTG